MKESGPVKDRYTLELNRLKKRLAEKEEWEARYKSLIKASPFAVTVTDLKGEITDLSRRTLTLHGYKRDDDLLGKNVSTLIAPEYRTLAAENMKKVLKEGFLVSVEYEFLRKDGTSFQGELDASLIKDAKGKPKGFIATTRDISHRKESEMAMKRSEERYRRIFESLHDVYYRTDRDGLVIEISPSVYAQAGWDPEDVIGHAVTDFYRDPASREIFTKSLKETGVVNDYELRLLAKDGRVIEVSVSAGIVFDKNGDPIGVEGVLRDITKRKRMEEALRESGEKFRTMVEHSLQGIFIIQDFKIVYANEALARITGFSMEELLSMSSQKIQDIVHPEDQDLVWGRMADRLVGKDVPSRYEFKAVRKDGETMFLEMVVGVIEFQGKPAVQGAVIDITDRKQADDQIQASLEEKEVMLREIHHRVKNNMQIILSLLRIQSRAVQDEKTSEMFQQSQNRIRSMALIHEGLYKSGDLARIDIADYISRMTTHLLSVYRPNLGDIKIEQEAEDVYLNINRAIPCGLIISEMVSNCLKHAFPGKRAGQITIRMTSDKQGMNSLIIKDNGIGFPEGLDFRQTETLGMQLVTDLVQQIEGSIELKRTQGTEFMVKFKGIDAKV